MIEPLPPLPESIAEIAEVIGQWKAMFFVGSLPPCGRRPYRRCFYVPARMPPDHPIVRLLGPEDAEKIRHHFQNCIIQPGFGREYLRVVERRQMQRRAMRGESVAAIAAAFGCERMKVRAAIERGKLAAALGHREE